MKKNYLLLIFMCIMITSCNNEKEYIEENVSNDRIEGTLADTKGVETVITLWGKDATVLDIGDYYLFQGDIMLSKDEYINEVSTKGAAVRNRKWTNNTVYYTINSNLPNPQRVYDAINHIESRTNIKFKERTTQNNYVEIVYSGNITYSDYVGMKGGKQIIGLEDWVAMGNVVHEFGHALGLFHEHTREDRDNYVIINFDLLTNSNDRYQYEKYSANHDGFDFGNFDFGSIMLYSTSYVGDRPIMAKLDGSFIYGQRQALSNGDRAILNSLYPMQIVAEQKSICINENVECTISGTIGTDLITWKSSSGISLISGQGTSSALFKGISNGEGVVKAEIVYNGMTWQLEEKIWVGAPIASSLTVINVDGTDWNSTILIGKGDSMGATSYKWAGLPVLYAEQANSEYISMASKHIINQGGLFLTVRRSNSCGAILSEYDIRVNGKSSAPSPYAKVSTSYNNIIQ